MNSADRVLKNGRIYTVDSADSVAQAVAIKGGRIVYVGSDAGLEGLIAAGTEVIDLAGRLVLPGFIDTHMHVPEGTTLAMYEVAMPEGLPADAYVPTIKAFADAHPELPSIRGAGWDDGLFAFEGPSKAELDKAVPDRPAVIRSSSMHSLWCNSKALELAGITKDTVAPPYGIIEKDPATGEPAGTLHESALELVVEKLPDYSTSQYLAAFDNFQSTVTGPCGITTCFDARMTPRLANAMEAIAEFEREGKLSVRMRAAFYIDPNSSLETQLDQAVALRARYQGPLFQVKSAKFFADGSGFSVFLNEPFSSVPAGYPKDYRGYPGWDPDALVVAAVKAAKLGFHLHFHAIGDAATKISLDAIEAVGRTMGKGDLRPAITHLFLVDESDKDRLADLGVVAVLQPIWMEKDPYFYHGYLPQLGEARCARMMPLKSLSDRGILVTSSTDYPITNPPSPLDGITIGVLRHHPLLSAPGDLWNPAEGATMREMIRSYTINGARALFLEDETGSIEVGKSADLVVLNENLLDIPAEKIGFNWMGGGSAKVLMTVFQGKTVYQANELR